MKKQITQLTGFILLFSSLPIFAIAANAHDMNILGCSEFVALSGAVLIYLSNK